MLPILRGGFIKDLRICSTQTVSTKSYLSPNAENIFIREAIKNINQLYDSRFYCSFFYTGKITTEGKLEEASLSNIITNIFIYVFNCVTYLWSGIPPSEKFYKKLVDRALIKVLKNTHSMAKELGLFTEELKSTGRANTKETINTSYALDPSIPRIFYSDIIDRTGIAYFHKKGELLIEGPSLTKAKKDHSNLTKTDLIIASKNFFEKLFGKENKEWIRPVMVFVSQHGVLSSKIGGLAGLFTITLSEMEILGSLLKQRQEETRVVFKVNKAEGKVVSVDFSYVYQISFSNTPFKTKFIGQKLTLKKSSFWKIVRDPNWNGLS